MNCCCLFIFLKSPVNIVAVVLTCVLLTGCGAKEETPGSPADQGAAGGKGTAVAGGKGTAAAGSEGTAAASGGTRGGGGSGRQNINSCQRMLYIARPHPIVAI